MIYVLEEENKTVEALKNDKSLMKLVARPRSPGADKVEQKGRMPCIPLQTSLCQMIKMSSFSNPL